MNASRIEKLNESGAVKWTMTPFPASDSNGIAVLVLPGGGYGHLALDHEGKQIAAWLNARGFDALVLEYSVASEKTPAPLGSRPLQDALEALAQIRTGQNSPAKIGVWGFSAGGHLAATLATHPESKLDFAILAYPVISMEIGATHGGSRANLIGANLHSALPSSFSAQNRVSGQTPPTFLFHTANDPAVPVCNALLFANALAAHQVPFELHIYENGRHGVGLASDDPVLSTWSARLEDWLKRR